MMTVWLDFTNLKKTFMRVLLGAIRHAFAVQFFV